MSIARHHAEWLSLVEVSGPFLSMPVLLEAFRDGLEAHDPDRFPFLEGRRTTKHTKDTKKEKPETVFINLSTGELEFSFDLSSVSSVCFVVYPSDLMERLVVARRIIAQRCLYGVDKNPLAVEMAKLSLWLLTLAKDKPFEFLYHAIRCGDSLVGIHNFTQLERLHLDADTVATRTVPHRRWDGASACDFVGE